MSCCYAACCLSSLPSWIEFAVARSRKSQVSNPVMEGMQTKNIYIYIYNVQRCICIMRNRYIFICICIHSLYIYTCILINIHKLCQQFTIIYKYYTNIDKQCQILTSSELSSNKACLKTKSCWTPKWNLGSIHINDDMNININIDINMNINITPHTPTPCWGRPQTGPGEGMGWGGMISILILISI